MEYSIFVGIMAIMCMVYMGSLRTSTDALMKAEPSSSDLTNFKVLTMISASQAKFIGMIFVFVGLIVFAIGNLLNVSFSRYEVFSYSPINVKSILLFFMLVCSAGILYTQSKMNHLFNSIGDFYARIPFDTKHRILRLNGVNNLMFILLCISLTLQFLIQGFKIA